MKNSPSLPFDYLISFIIITSKDFKVCNAIDSLMKTASNSKRQWEIVVVVNGCSTEFKKKLEKDYLDRNVKFVYCSEGNRAKARNMGINHSQGEYLVHIDSDCEIAEKYFDELKKVCNFDMKIGRGKVKFVSSDALLSKASCELKKYAYNNRKERAYTPNLVVKREVYDLVGLYDEEFFSGEDNEWSLRFKELDISFRYFNNLSLKHFDHESSSKIIKTYFNYGVARYNRFKKNKFKVEFSFKQKIKKYYELFNEIPSLKFFRYKKTIFILYLIRNIGVLFAIIKDKCYNKVRTLTN